MIESDAEDALANSLELVGDETAVQFLGSLLTSMPGFVSRIDSEFRIRFLNRTAGDIRFEDAIGASVFDYIAPKYREVARECFLKVIETGESHSYEAVAGAGDDSAFYISHVSPISDNDGSTGLCIVSVDITADRRREEALRTSRQKLDLVTEASEMGLWEWNMQTDEVQWNDRMYEIMGRDTPLIAGEYMEKCVHPEDRQVVSDRYELLMTADKFSGSVSRIVRSNGEIRWVMSSGVLNRDEAGRPARLLGSTLDVTNQHATQAQQRRGQKLQAIGNLTAGVAHNFNNMLMVLLPTLDLLEAEEVPRPDLLHDAREAAQRAAEVVRQLMTFAGQGHSGTQRTHRVANIVGPSVHMARRAFGSNVAVRAQEYPQLGVRCDVGAIQQVLMNLLLNARDAVASTHGGASIEVFVDEAQSRRDTDTAASAFVRIRIRDNGIGMSSEVSSQIFEPFFTTKGADGTGLGLSTSYAIIREHGGWIECQSTEGEGTAMIVWLPAAELSTEESEAELCRVLLVDDDDSVRRLVGRVLSTQYDVVEADSVAAAEELLRHDTRFDIVMLDQSMPGGDGFLLLPTLRRELPNAPVLYFTGGHVENPAEVDGVIAKPVSRGDLLEALAVALSG